MGTDILSTQNMSIWGENSNYQAIVIPTNNSPTLGFTNPGALGVLNAVYNSTLPTVTDSYATFLQTDNKGRLIITSQSSAPNHIIIDDALNPATFQMAGANIGNNVANTNLFATASYGQFNSSVLALTAGKYAAMQLDIEGRLWVNPSLFVPPVTLNLSYSGNKIIQIVEHDATRKITSTITYTGNKITQITEVIAPYP